MNKLKPCPFCGGSVDLVHTTHKTLDLRNHHFICFKCNTQFFLSAKGKYRSADEADTEAIAMWNRRTPDTHNRVVERLENLEVRKK